MAADLVGEIFARIVTDEDPEWCFGDRAVAGFRIAVAGHCHFAFCFLDLRFEFVSKCKRSIKESLVKSSSC